MRICKHLLCMLLAMLMLELVVPVFSSAAQAESGSFALPQSLKKILAESFYGATGISDVTIPDGTTEIGSLAFAHSTLQAISLPASLTAIADNAFEGCEGLTVTAPEGSYAYNWAVANGYIKVDEPDPTPDSDFEYTIANGEVTITKYVGSAAHVVIPEVIEGCPVTGIGDEAFVYEEGRFSQNESLISIDIPDTITSIGAFAFMSCTSLTSLNLPDSITSIGKGAFAACTSLNSVNLPNSISRLPDVLFLSCIDLTSINIPNSVTEIGAFALAGTGIASIDLPSSITSIGEYSFSACRNLINIDLPNGITTIPYAAFWDCSSLSTISFPNSVTSIEEDAFSQCTNLTCINMPSSITRIDSDAFRQCPNLSFRLYRGSYAQTYARNNGIPCTYISEVALDTFPSDYYQIIHTFTYDGDVYYEAELLKSYNGVAISTDTELRTFFMDSQKHVVTDASLLSQLYTLKLFADDEDSIRSLLRTWKTTAQKCSSTATRFLNDEMLVELLGSTAAKSIKSMMGTPATFSLCLLELAKVVTDSNAVSAITLIVITEDLASHLEQVIDVTLDYTATVNGKYDYDRVVTMLDCYSYCGVYYQASQGVSMYIIDDILANYSSGWGLAWDRLVTFATSAATAWIPEDAKLAPGLVKLTGMVLKGDINAENFVNSLLAFIRPDFLSISANFLAGSVNALSDVTGIDPEIRNDFLDPYYLTVEEMRATDLYKAQQLLAQPLP